MSDIATPTQTLSSPVKKGAKVSLIKTINIEKLKAKYLSNFSIDVSRFFDNLSEIEVYRCDETGYQFYYPFNLDGDGQFYEELERFEWYYLDWKWEHTQTKGMLKKGQSVLEVGCGPASFVKRLQQEGFEAVGLELNEHCVKQAQQQGLDVRLELVQEHAKNSPEKYDLVCSFQVLEHIADVQSYIQASLDCLKPGGKLVVCVPNNGAFIKDDPLNVLNMPPHHMGLWQEGSLRNLENCFPMQTNEIRFEPLEERHFHWYRKIWESKYLPKESSLIYRIYHKLGLFRILDKLIASNSQKIHGHSVLAVYQKLD